MNRLLLILLLIGIGAYVYIVLYRNNNYFNNYFQAPNNHPEFINDEFIEQPNRPRERSKVHFSDKNEEFIIPNKEDIARDNQSVKETIKSEPNKNSNLDNLYDDIFIVDPIEIKNTHLTLSENEYFNNM
jgi:hypothetical protein